MNFLLEYKNFYKENDIVYIEYWYDGRITPVILKEKQGNKKFLVSHDIKQSKIFNAPDEIIKISQIIDKI